MNIKQKLGLTAFMALGLADSKNLIPQPGLPSRPRKRKRLQHKAWVKTKAKKRQQSRSRVINRKK